MTTTSPTAAPVTPLGKQDIKDVARHLYGLEVQYSRLDLMAYDASKPQQKLWYGVAKKMVRRLEAEGRNITVVR